jgi:hypothetical protein
MVRVRAGISYALTEAMDEGHCGLPTEELIQSGAQRSAATWSEPQGMRLPPVDLWPCSRPNGEDRGSENLALVPEPCGI